MIGQKITRNIIHIVETELVKFMYKLRQRTTIFSIRFAYKNYGLGFVSCPYERIP